MKNILFLFFIIYANIYASSALESAIKTSAQRGCYLRGIDTGDTTAQSLYNATITSQVLYDTRRISNGNCDTFESNPYVIYDLEIDRITALLSCTVTTDSDGNKESVEEYYHLDFSCNKTCPIPKDNLNNQYIKYTDTDEAHCSLAFLDASYQNAYPNTGKSVVDAQWLTCESNPSITGCYINIKYTTENNSTEYNNSTTSSTTGIGLSTEDSNNLSSVNNHLKNIEDKLYDTSEVSKYDSPEDTFTSLQSDIGATSSEMKSHLTNIFTTFSEHTAPIFISGEGSSVFTANVYGKTIVFDLRMFLNLRDTFNILWTLLLAYFAFKIYFLIIRDMFNKI